MKLMGLYIKVVVSSQTRMRGQCQGFQLSIQQLYIASCVHCITGLQVDSHLVCKCIFTITCNRQCTDHKTTKSGLILPAWVAGGIGCHVNTTGVQHRYCDLMSPKSITQRNII